MRKKEFKKVLAAVLAAGNGSRPLSVRRRGTASETTAAAAAAQEAQEETVGEAGGAVEGLVAEEGAEIEIAYWEGSTSDKAAWDELLANLQKDHPEIKIVPQTYPSGDFPEMLDTRVAGDDWPDVIRYTYQRLGSLRRQM